jgi:hypothetical protein
MRFWEAFPHDTTGLEKRAAWQLDNFANEPNSLRLYDRDGRPRQVIWLIESIHGGKIDPVQFAQGFDQVAQRLEARTGHRVGFVIDPTPLPAYGSHEGPQPQALRQCASILAINPFNITSQGLGERKDAASISASDRLAYARRILQQWHESDIPLIAPVIPGYDAHLTFPKAGRYGFDHTWRSAQRELVLRYETAGMSIDCWNGWTEGYAIPPSVQDGDVHMRWVRQIVGDLRRKWAR